ncbi:unnamed protein product [Cutaneotrichosporon oleaginosum]
MFAGSDPSSPPFHQWQPSNAGPQIRNTPRYLAGWAIAVPVGLQQRKRAAKMPRVTVGAPEVDLVYAGPSHMIPGN